MNEERRIKPERVVQISLVLSVLASIALTVVYWLGGQPQAEGALLFVSLGGLAVGLLVWARSFMPGGAFIQERHEATERPEQEAPVTVEDPTEGVPRRAFFVRLFAAAISALGVAAIFPVRSLGSKPGSALFKTSWSPGARLVTREGIPVRAQDLDVGGVVTVFPEGYVDSADSQTLLIRLEEGEARPLPGREDWAPEGNVAYSKICTHAGCPVGLYDQDLHQLICPCHQSVFEVLDGAAPTAGPATRALPQLPLDVDEEGYLTARDDFTEPVGPGFWNLP
jgi:ubiquinol-cytochrome c reductase iron-sulfur subunit